MLTICSLSRASDVVSNGMKTEHENYDFSYDQLSEWVEPHLYVPISPFWSCNLYIFFPEIFQTLNYRTVKAWLIVGLFMFEWD
jgi:hypothetical protein